MVDLEAAGERLATWDAGVVLPPAGDILRRGGRRRKRRVAARTAGTLAVLACVAAGAWALGASRSSVAPPTQVGPPGNPVHTPAVAHPVGWTEQEFGLLSYWIPPSPGQCSLGPGPGFPGGYKAMSLGANCNGLGTSPSPGTPIVIKRAARRPQGRRIVLNTLAAWESHHGADIVVYDLPRFGVRFELWGRVGAEVGRTIGPSGLDAVLTTPQPVAVPGGWKTVSWGGFSASVPRSWAVTTVHRRPSNFTPRELANASAEDRRIMEHQCDLFPRAGVYRGAPTWTCQALSYAEVAGGLWLGKDVNPGPRATPFSTSSGATVVARWSPYAGDPSLMGFTVHGGGRTSEGTLLIGPDPVLAEEILSSIRVTGSTGS